MSHARETRGSVLAAVGLLVTLIVPLALLRGWALAHLWSWFVVPLGVPVVGYVHAFGLSLVWSFFEGAKKPSEDQGWIIILRSAITGVATSLLTVGAGWIVRQWL